MILQLLVSDGLFVAVALHGYISSIAALDTGDKIPGSSILTETLPPQSGLSFTSPSQPIQPQGSCSQMQTDPTQQVLGVRKHGIFVVWLILSLTFCIFK